MALSQKHKGAIFVPWFCTNEWKYVYDLLYSTHSEDYHKREALKIIKIWKARMPLFQSGLEGTLVILEALFPDGNIEGEYLQLLQSTAIMRFLNICVSSHTKQTTIYDSAKKHNIPNWIVTIRHNLAHSQKLTSLSMLKSALEFCMQWLKTSYWEYHYNLFEDYTPTENEKRIKFYLQIYCDILMACRAKLSYVSDLGNKLITKVKSALGEEFDNDATIDDVLHLLWHLLLTVRKKNKLYYGEILIDELLENTRFVNVSKDTLQADNDSLTLYYVTTWSKLIIDFNKSEMLPLLVRKLYIKTADGNCDHTVKYCCSLCLNAIFKSLLFYVQVEVQKQLSEKSVDSNKYINFSNIKRHTLKHLQSFLRDVVKNPNEYTNNYIKPLLLLHNKEQEYIQKVELLINSYTTKAGKSMTDKDVESTPILKPVTEKSNGFDCAPSAMDCDEMGEKEVKNAVVKSSRWQLIEDKSLFDGCALGLWPGQVKDWNPLLSRIDI